MMWLTVILVIILVFRGWFSLTPVSSGDLSFFYPEQIREYLNLPFAWESFRGSGLGGNSLLHQGVYFYNLPLGFLGQFFTYGFLERLIWFLPILIVGLLSPIVLAREINIFPSRFCPLASLIFLLNTYFLMIMGGGQLTVVLAYVMIPLVLALFLKTIKESEMKNIILFSLALSFLIAWDFRLAYIFFSLLFFYFISRLRIPPGSALADEAGPVTVRYGAGKKEADPRTETPSLRAGGGFIFFWQENLRRIKKYFLVFFVFFWAGIILLGFHSFWLLPFLLNYNNPVASFSSAYTTFEAVRFFSFAKFENSLSLLHPNWPENIFGKTYFMRPEFLLLPILAYSSLLFVNKSKAKILFFAMLGLIGAFLAKGASPPFGEAYVWLFEYFPGMIMFRDSTKFYLLIALSYSILIPFSVWQIHEWLKSKVKLAKSEIQGKIKKYLPRLFIVSIVIYFLLLIKPAIFGELGGTFKSREVPKEYVILKDFLVSQPEFFRTFWVPKKQRFGFYTNNHPAIDGQDLLRVASPSGVVDWLKNSEAQENLSQWSVKYLIIPYDSEGEIFLKDREYDEEQRRWLEEQLDKIFWLKKHACAAGSFAIYYNNTYYCSGKIAVYELREPKDHFWLEVVNQRDATALHNTVAKEGDDIRWRMVNPTRYIVSLKNLRKPATLVFSESFDSGWVAKIGSEKVLSEKVYERLNGFKINKVGDLNIIVDFEPQKYINFGLLISALTLLLTVLGLVLF